MGLIRGEFPVFEATLFPKQISYRFPRDMTPSSEIFHWMLNGSTFGTPFPLFDQNLRSIYDGGAMCHRIEDRCVHFLSAGGFAHPEKSIRIVFRKDDRGS